MESKPNLLPSEDNTLFVNEALSIIAKNTNFSTINALTTTCHFFQKNAEVNTIKALKQEVDRLNFEIPDAVFQFGLDRNTALQYLQAHPEIPFILRLSRIDGYFVLDIPNSGRTDAQHILVSPPKPNEKGFKVGNREQSVFTETRSLELHFKIYWEPEHKRMLSNSELKGKEAWEKFKGRQQQNQSHKIAVLSIQSLDQKKIALAPEDLHAFAQENSGLQIAGAGHTGFAMAMALNAPFIVVRSNENRDESNGILQQHIGDNGLIVVTGHSSQGLVVIKGDYMDINKEETALYNKQIERGPHDIVSTTMDAGLINGNHITILLSICYGALTTSQGTGDSFAHKLSREFAAKGISSTIIASDEQFLRFGTNAIIDEKITFNNRAGMAAENVHVFTTEVDGPNSNPQTNVYKPNEAVQLAKSGVEFLNPNAPQISLAQKTLEEHHRQQLLERLQKQAEEQQISQQQGFSW